MLAKNSNKPSANEPVNQILTEGYKTFSDEEFCRMVGISRITSWRLRNSGKLAHCKVGAKVIYKPEHIKQFLDAHEK